MKLPAPKRYMLFFELVLALFLLIIVITPLTLPAGSVPPLDGHIGRIDNSEELQDMPWPQRSVYLLGDVYCHQQVDRSFSLNDNQLPICSRDLGLLSGTVIGLAAFIIKGGRARWELLALMLIPMAIDGGLQAVTSYESTNLVRWITGCIAGLAIGWGVGALVGGFFARKDGSDEVSQ